MHPARIILALWQRPRRWACLVLLLVLGLPLSAQTLQAVPSLTSRVTDLSQTLTTAEQRALEEQLATFERAQGTQILILLLPSTQPEDIASYANRVFNAWKPGRAGIGDGLLIVAAMQDRTLRIEVARALEGAIPDLAAKRIIDEVLTPHFRSQNYAQGLQLAAERLMGLVRGEALPPPTRRAAADAAETRWLDMGILLLIVLPALGSISRRIFGHKHGTVLTGAVAAYMVFSFTASLLLAMLAGLLTMLLTYLAGTTFGGALLDAAQGPHAGRHSHGDWGGGFGGSSDGGFGSGGGGDGAGGGASGGW